MSDSRLRELQRLAESGDAAARLLWQQELWRRRTPAWAAWSDLPLDVDDSLLRSGEFTTQALEDLSFLATERFLAHVPRDSAGRLELLSLPLLLARYPRPKEKKDLYLAAATPRRRRDPQVITFTLGPYHGEHHRRSWVKTRCWWDSRAELSEARLWGAPGVLERIRHGQLDEPSSLAARIAGSVLQARAGNYPEAGATWEVAIGFDVQEILNGPAKRFEPRWRPVLQETLTRVAWWRLPVLLDLEEARLTTWIAEKPRRRRRDPSLVLCAFPHQPWQSKLCLTLSRSPATGRNTLCLTSTSHNQRLATDLWQLPPETLSGA